MSVNKIVDEGPSEDILLMVEKGSKIELFSYKAGSGVIKVHPMLEIRCMCCDRVFANKGYMGHCSCDPGRKAAIIKDKKKKKRPAWDQRSGRPFCTKHRELMIWDYHKDRWVCTGCEPY